MAREKKRRRNRGEGSIEETADGRFRIRYSYVDSRGERHKPSKTCDTRKQCYTWYAEQVGKSHGTYDTFDQWFTAWLEIQRAKRAHATWDRDRQVVESHLRPEWGRSKVKALTLTAFERWFGRLQAAGESSGSARPRGRSASSSGPAAWASSSPTRRGSHAVTATARLTLTRNGRSTAATGSAAFGGRGMTRPMPEQYGQSGSGEHMGSHHQHGVGAVAAGSRAVVGVVMAILARAGRHSDRSTCNAAEFTWQAGARTLLAQGTVSKRFGSPRPRTAAGLSMLCTAQEPQTILPLHGMPAVVGCGDLRPWLACFPGQGDGPASFCRCSCRRLYRRAACQQRVA